MYAEWRIYAPDLFYKNYNESFHEAVPLTPDATLTYMAHL